MDVTQITVRTHDGSTGMMAKHEPLLAARAQGTIRIQRDGAWSTYRTDPFIISSDGTTVTILCPGLTPA
jgi:F0F1-type ATP synthase epsilon subunit